MEAHGTSLLDAPVVGSLPQAEAAQLVLLAGGAQEIFLKAQPVLGCIAGVVHHVGPQGQGSTMKLAANALLAIQVAAIAETLAVLDKSGIAPKRALEIISGLPVMSPAGNGFAGLMVTGDFAPRFTAALIAKDLRYAVGEGPSLRRPQKLRTTARITEESYRHFWHDIWTPPALQARRCFWNQNRTAQIYPASDASVDAGPDDSRSQEPH